jgi:nucleoside-diphosphate-sugar epimerase
MTFWYNIAFKQDNYEQQIKMLESQVSSFTDVRDVAEGHVRALQSGKAEGRIVLAADNYTWEEFCECLRVMTFLMDI